MYGELQAKIESKQGSVDMDIQWYIINVRLVIKLLSNYYYLINE